MRRRNKDNIMIDFLLGAVLGLSAGFCLAVLMLKNYLARFLERVCQAIEDDFEDDE